MLMAMGTSALEGAKLGIPTILLDACYGEVPNGYMFQWLHERSGYTLGEVMNAGHVVTGNCSLQKCIQQLVSEYPKLSNSAHSHFEKYHAIGNVTKRLLQLAGNAKCTYGDFSKARLAGRGTLYKCFDYLRKNIAND